MSLVDIVVAGQASLTIFLNDVSEKKRAEADLEAARARVQMSEKLTALASLVSGVAHEVRTPLTYIRNNIFLVRTRAEALAKRVEAGELRTLAEGMRAPLDNAEEGVDRINELVKDLRRFSTGPAGERQIVEIHRVVGASLNLFRATHAGMFIGQELKPTPPVLASPLQVQQIIINLLQNAIEASPPGTNVHVSTGPLEGGGARIVVEDMGPGIPPDIQARMFDPFFTTKAEGTGLGLSIVKRIVEEHAGAIECTSRIGKGTRFELKLPPYKPGEDARGLGARTLTVR